MADNSKKIRDLQAALSSGLRQVTTDGTTTSYQSRDEMIRELNRLHDSDDASLAAGKRRPRVTRLNLRNAF